MEPLFDNLAEEAFTHITDLMGESAVWHSSSGESIPGRVLFKNPTEPIKLGDSEAYEYRPSDTTAEYYVDTFIGLREAVDQHRTEYLEVRGGKYLIVDIDTKFDGNTYVARLEPHND